MNSSKESSNESDRESSTESGKESGVESSKVELCRHVFTDGRACKGAAVRGLMFCRHHREIKKTIYCVAPVEPDPYRVHPPMGLRFPEDRASLQINYYLVMRALEDHRITQQTANCYNRLLRSCEQNLRHGPLFLSDPAEMVRDLAFNQDGLEVGPARCLPEAAAIVPHTSEERLCGPHEGEKEDISPAQPAEAETLVPGASEDRLCGTPEGEKEDISPAQPAEAETLVPHTNEERLAGAPDGKKEDISPAQPAEAETLVPRPSEAGVSWATDGVSGSASWPYVMRSASPPDYGVTDPCSLETLRQRQERYANYVRATMRRNGEPLEWDNYLR